MDTLPPELIIRILKLLDATSYANARESASLFCIDSDVLIEEQVHSLKVKNNLLQTWEQACETFKKAHRTADFMGLTHDEIHEIGNCVQNTFNNIVLSMRQHTGNFDDVHLKKNPPG